MFNDVAIKWIQALESGKYNQCTGRLNNGNGFCCLGVLCEVVGLKFESFRDIDGNLVWGIQEKKHRETHTTPDKAMILSGMQNVNGYIKSKGLTLSKMNDEGRSFKEIAQIIKENWEEL